MELGRRIQNIRVALDKLSEEVWQELKSLSDELRECLRIQTDLSQAITHMQASVERYVLLDV